MGASPAGVAALLALAAVASIPVACSRRAEPSIRAVARTRSVRDNPDDAAIWVDPADPSRSVLVGNAKIAAPRGALVVFDLEGNVLQTVHGIDRPNNVDVESGFLLGGKPVDVVAATGRLDDRLWVYAIDPATRTLRDVSGGGCPVFHLPMGVGLYRRPRDGNVFAILSRKRGPRDGYLGQYLLEDAGDGTVRATLVREFGTFVGDSEIEAVVVDDELGHVYWGEETEGVHQGHADPDHPDAAREIALFAREDFDEDREGLALWCGEGGRGYLVCADQRNDGVRLHVFRREGAHEKVGVVRCEAVSTDGIEATSRALGPAFPRGLLVAMNDAGNDYLIYRWEDVETALGVAPVPNPSASARK